jgi:hypothetical protein
MVEFHMVPADSRLAVDIRRAAVHILVADTHQTVDIRRVAVHILVADCYRDLIAEVALGEGTHHIDLADLGLGLD